jgi:hypothetical protein
LAFSYWIDKPWFLTEGKTCCYIHHTFLLGFPNWSVIYFITTAPSIAISYREIGRIQELFLAPCRRGESLPEAFYTTMVASRVMCE